MTKRTKRQDIGDTRGDPTKAQIKEAAAVADKARDEAVSGPTGPAAGMDPSVRVPVNAEANVAAHDPAYAMQLAEDNGAGPRQEPIHRSSPPAAEHEVTLNEDGEKSVKEPAKPKFVKMTDITRDRLTASIMKAMAGGDPITDTDDNGRAWSIYSTTVSNQSVVLVQLARGAEIAPPQMISTSLLSTDSGQEYAQNAVDALDGVLK